MFGKTSPLRNVSVARQSIRHSAQCRSCKKSVHVCWMGLWMPVIKPLAKCSWSHIHWRHWHKTGLCPGMTGGHHHYRSSRTWKTQRREVAYSCLPGTDFVESLKWFRSIYIIYFYIFLNFLKFIQDIAHSAQVMEIYRCSNDQLPPRQFLQDWNRQELLRCADLCRKTPKSSELDHDGSGTLVAPNQTVKIFQDLSRSFSHLYMIINVCLEIVDQACCCRALVWAGVAAV